METTQHINQHFKNPICFIDIESTGIDKFNDRICQISIIKLLPSGEKIIKTRYVNTTIPIPKAATDINGITDEMVSNEPTFSQIAKGINEFIQDCDLAGYNSNNFDIPMLIAEFERSGIDFKFNALKNKIIDVYRIYSHFNKIDLPSCYQDYTQKLLVNSHDAQNDAMATLEIFEKMMEVHGELRMNDDLFQIQSIDLCGFIGMNQESELIFLFGKHKGKKLKDEISYCNWILEKGDFPQRVKKIVASILPGK